MGEAAGQRAAVVVRHAAEGAAALRLAAGRPLLLLSAPGAAGMLGAVGWRALVARAAEGQPGGAFADALCCAAEAGHALAALRAGCPILVLLAEAPGFATVAGAAAEAGALLLPARPPALDLRELDLARPAGQARLAHWLAMAPDDRATAKG